MTIVPRFQRAELVDPEVPFEMAWVDYETTGLEPHGDIPLELGLMLTDKRGKVRATFRSLLMTDNWKYKLKIANTTVQEMHAKNGLADDLHKAELEPIRQRRMLHPEEVAYTALDFLVYNGGPTGQIPMAGSTVNFDRGFMVYHMDELNKWFHYRNIDVSTIKNLARMHNPDLYAQAPQEKPEDKKHRPLQDLAASIREYQFYLDNFLQTS